MRALWSLDYGLNFYFLSLIYLFKCPVSKFLFRFFLDKDQNDSKYEEASINNSRMTGGMQNTSNLQRSPFVAQNSQSQTLRDTSNLKGKIVSLEVSKSLTVNFTLFSRNPSKYRTWSDNLLKN